MSWATWPTRIRSRRTDVDGLVELCRAIDTPVHIGEFIFSIYDYAAYIRAGALDVLRLIVDNIGGITGGLKVAHLAECFGMECAPHNWGGPFDHAVHFHLELAMPNNVWFEITQPMEQSDRPYIKDKIRIDEDGYVHAPTKPGLGYEIDRDVLDRMTTEVLTCIGLEGWRTRVELFSLWAATRPGGLL